MEVIVSAVVVLVFLSVTTCAAVVNPTAVEAKVRLVGESVAVAVTAVPVPFSATVCGEPLALSAIERDAASEPATVGLNSTETVQLAPAARLPAQVVADFTNEVAFVPVIVSDVIETAVVPVFLMVTACAAVVAPTLVDANVRLVGDTLTLGAVVPPGHAFTRFATLKEPRPVVRSYPAPAL